MSNLRDMMKLWKSVKHHIILFNEKFNGYFPGSNFEIFKGKVLVKGNTGKLDW